MRETEGVELGTHTSAEALEYWGTVGHVRRLSGLGFTESERSGIAFCRTLQYKHAAGATFILKSAKEGSYIVLCHHKKRALGQGRGLELRFLMVLLAKGGSLATTGFPPPARDCDVVRRPIYGCLNMKLN